MKGYYVGKQLQMLLVKACLVHFKTTSLNKKLIALNYLQLKITLITLVSRKPEFVKRKN